MSEPMMDMTAYLMTLGIVQLICSVTVLLVALPFVARRGWRAYGFLALRVLLFNVPLLIFGCIANSVWMFLAYGRWYVSTDTWVDFYPFIPFGQWVLDSGFGGGQLLNGASLRGLQVLWLALATGVWGCTLVTYRWSRRKLGASYGLFSK